jgi:membrane protein implicated in regulation of membrane protease activity
MPWWLWLIAGFMLMLAEFLTLGGFYIIFFGAGAVLVGLLSLFGLSGPQWLEWILFTIFSVAGIMLFRTKLRNRLEIPPRPDDTETIVGKIVVVVEPIPIGSVGRVEMSGTAWTAKNLGQQPLTSGESVTVEELDGLILGVRAHR